MLVGFHFGKCGDYATLEVSFGCGETSLVMEGQSMVSLSGKKENRDGGGVEAEV